jgi:hypothetical protein
MKSGHLFDLGTTVHVHEIRAPFVFRTLHEIRTILQSGHLVFRTLHESGHCFALSKVSFILVGSTTGTADLGPV